MISTIFLGTPVASVAILEAACRVSEVKLVVTRPDRPRGRSGRPQPSPVREAAAALGLPSATAGGRRELSGVLARGPRVDAGIVAAFGVILSRQALVIPGKGFVNVHFSLLPRWRGAAPVERAILAGDEMTGVSLMAMEADLDTGAIVARRSVAIYPEDTSQTLLERLTTLGGEMLEADLPGFVTGALLPSPQSREGVTYAHKIEPEEARLSVSGSAGTALRQIRAFNPRPGAFALLDGRRFKVWEAHPSPSYGLEPGELRMVEGSLRLGVGDAALKLVMVQTEGGRRMRAEDWARGRRDNLGRLT